MLPGTGEYIESIESENINEEDKLIIFDDYIKPPNSLKVIQEKWQLKSLQSSINTNLVLLLCFTSILDGYLLMFIGYNQSVIKQIWKWSDLRTQSLNIIYHLVTGLGGIYSAYTTNLTNLKGLNLNILLCSMSFIFSIILLCSKEYYVYISCFTIICFSNGHLFNIGTNMIIYKFSQVNRAFVYSLVYFFNQVGKFCFAALIYKFNEVMLLGKFKITIIPLIILILIILIFNISLVLKQITKIKMKSNDDQNKNSDFIFSVERNKKSNFSLASQLEKNKRGMFILENSSHNTLFKAIFVQIRELYTHPSLKGHIIKLSILNISLGIQFFSMISIFPHISQNFYFSNLVNEIFYSKLIHTILLFFLPVLLLMRFSERKRILKVVFLLNMLLIIFIMFGFFNAILNIQAFRVLWDVSFITVNLYSAEAITKKYRNINTSIMYFLFKMSCLFEIYTIDFLISISIYIPIFLNLLLLILDIVLTWSMICDPHFHSLKEIEEILK